MPRQQFNQGDISTPYIRAAQLPPLHPEDREASIKRLTAIYDNITRQSQIERRQRLLSWVKFAP